VKRFEIGGEGNGPDIADHFISDNIEKTIDQVKSLSAESSMRKINA